MVSWGATIAAKFCTSQTTSASLLSAAPRTRRRSSWAWISASLAAASAAARLAFWAGVSGLDGSAGGGGTITALPAPLEPFLRSLAAYQLLTTVGAVVCT